MWLTRVCISLALLQVISGLVVVSPPALAGRYFNSPRKVPVGPSNYVFNVTGVVTLYSSGDFKDKLVLQDVKQPFNDFEEQTPILHEAGALGFIIVLGGSAEVDVTGLGSFAWNAKFPDILLPSVEISLRSFHELLPFIENGTQVTITFDNADPNIWANSFESPWMIAYSIVLGVATLGTIVYAVYKLACFARRGSGSGNIGTTVLAFEVVSNALRFIAVAVDPLQSRRVFPFLVNNILYTISFPFVIVSILLITLYWYKLIQQTARLGKVRSFLQKLRIPFWMLFTILLAIDVAGSVLRGLNYPMYPLLVISCTSYIAVVLALTIFFLYTGFQLRSILSDYTTSAVKHDRKKTRLEKTTFHIILSSVGLFGWIIPMVIGGLTPLLWVPDNFIALWFAIYFSTTFSSFFRVMAIHAPGGNEGPVSASAIEAGGETTSANINDR